MTIGGLEFSSDATAKSKKDAQTNATWSFCEKLADLGYMDRNDFPQKEKVATNAAGSIPSDWKQILNEQHIEEAGGWTPDTCQKRLQGAVTMGGYQGSEKWVLLQVHTFTVAHFLAVFCD